jgi:hypothetical protein
MNISMGRIQLSEEAFVEEKLDVIEDQAPVDYKKIKMDYDALLTECKRVYNIHPTKEMYDFWITLSMAERIEFDRDNSKDRDNASKKES